MTSNFDHLYDRTGYRVKDKQKALIYGRLRFLPGSTRKELAEKLSLRPSTVSNLVEELIDDGLVYEGELRPQSGQGRRQISLYPNVDRFVAIALYFVSMTLKGALVNCGNHVRSEHTLTLSENTGHDALNAGVVESTQALRADKPAEAELVGCGVTFPGFVDTYNNRWVFAARWPRLREFDLTGLQSQVDLPIRFRRSLDAELEYLLEQNPRYRKGGTVLVHWGYGIGSSYACDGLIIETAVGGFGEIGHVNLHGAPDGRVCVCGRRGCVETEAALWAVLPHLQDAAPDLPMGEEEFADAFVERDLEKHPAVQHAVAEFTRAMVVLYTVLAPDHMVLYGPFLDCDTVFERVRDAIHTDLSLIFAKRLSIERISAAFSGDLFGSTSPFFRETYTRYLLAK